MNHCEIVCDLLPLYIEDMTSQGSRELIRDHLCCCNRCMEEYKRMTAPVLPQPEPNEKWKAALEAQRQAEKKQKCRSILLWSVLLLALLALGVPQLKHYINTHKTTTHKITSIEADEILTLCPAVVPTEKELYFLTRVSTLPILTETGRVIPEEEFAPYRDDLIPSEAQIGYIDGGKYYLSMDYFMDSQRTTLAYTDEDMDGTFDSLLKFIHPSYQEGFDMPCYSATYSTRTATTQYEKHE